MHIYIITQNTDKSSLQSDDKQLTFENIKSISIEDTKKKIWQGIQECVKDAASKGHNRITLCTKIDLLKDNALAHLSHQILEDAENLNAKILIINADNADLMIPLSNDLVWVDHCSGIGLAVIFKSCYPLILMEDGPEEETLDHRISLLTSNKFIVYPLQVSTNTRTNDTKSLNKRIKRLIEQSDILYM